MDATERPPDEDPRPDEEDETRDTEDERDQDIDDPLKRDEDVRFFKDERILGVTLKGPKVGKRSIDVFTLGEFLAQLDRVVRALTAQAEGLTLAPSGKIPRPPEAAPWRARALRFGHSATLDFALGEPEAMRMSEAGHVTSPTIEAVVALGSLVQLDAQAAVGRVREFDDRIGTDYAALLALLADNVLTTTWEPIRAEPISVGSEQADRVRNALRREVDPVTGLVTVSGFLFRLDAKKNDFKLEPEDAPPLTGSYHDDLKADLRDAWSHRVVAELSSTQHRYAYATRPHKVEYRLTRIVKKLGPVELVADDQAEAS